jgi:hypothetical protein
MQLWVEPRQGAVVAARPPRAVGMHATMALAQLPPVLEEVQVLVVVSYASTVDNTTSSWPESVLSPPPRWLVSFSVRAGAGARESDNGL